LIKEAGGRYTGPIITQLNVVHKSEAILPPICGSLIKKFDLRGGGGIGIHEN